jgi:hypothetical protein
MGLPLVVFPASHHKMFPLYMSIKNVLSRHPLHLTWDGHRTLPTICSELIAATAILFTVEFGELNELTDGNTDTQHKDDIFPHPGHWKKCGICWLLSLKTSKEKQNPC